MAQAAPLGPVCRCGGLGSSPRRGLGIAQHRRARVRQGPGRRKRRCQFRRRDGSGDRKRAFRQGDVGQRNRRTREPLPARGSPRRGPDRIQGRGLQSRRVRAVDPRLAGRCRRRRGRRGLRFPNRRRLRIRRRGGTVRTVTPFDREWHCCLLVGRRSWPEHRPGRLLPPRLGLRDRQPAPRPECRRGHRPMGPAAGSTAGAHQARRPTPAARTG
jgi:hypothetical protein